MKRRKDEIRVPTHTGRALSRRTIKRGPERPRPVHIELFPTTVPETDTLPTFVFHRARPKCTWVVPPIKVGLYWFDIVMLRKGLMEFIRPDVFICDGRRFRVLHQEQNVIGIGYTRWLVYQESSSLAHGGRP